MRYIGNFYSLKGDRYTVEIITNGTSGTTRNITLGVPPFVTEMDTSDDNIYKPVKYQSATVKIVTSAETDYKFDIYSGEANGTKIRLYDNDNNLIWGGFSTPVLYNNGFTEIHEELEVQAIDGLSILQYYKYSAASKQILSLAEIIMKILSRCEVYKTLYVSNNVYRVANVPILNDIYISEQNFFDEKKDNETDDDVAWTCQEVLEEICQYLGYVLVGDGDSLYMLDYDAIKGGYNGYFKYNIGSTAYTQVTLSKTLAIAQSDYMGGSNNISLDNVYNKVSVKDSFYTFDSVIPSIYDGAVNVTKSSDSGLANSENINNGMYGEVVSGKMGDQDSDTNNNMIVMIDRVYDPENEEYTTYNACFLKYYLNPNYNFYSYFGATNSALNYTDTKSYHGACILKADIEKLDKAPSDLERWIKEVVIGKKMTLDEWLARNEIGNVSFKNYLMMLNIWDSHYITYDKIQNYPYVSTKDVNTTALFGGNNAYLIISGKYVWHYFNEDPYPIPTGEDIDVEDGRFSMDVTDTYILAKLQWGDLYWNGSAWTTSNTTFKIRYMNEASDDDDRRADATMFKDLDFVNTVSWRIGTDEKGYCIPVPTDRLLSGLPKITLYCPYTPNYHSSKTGDDKGHVHDHSVVFLKDFDIKAIIGDPTYSDVNESDTIYTNVIDEHHVQDFDEIEFKICTHDNKNPNYSCTAYKDNVGYHFITNLTNSALRLTQRAEELLINRLCNQYKQPRIRLELQLNNNIVPYQSLTTSWLTGKKFVVDSQSIDYYNNQSTITLVEK